MNNLLLAIAGLIIAVFAAAFAVPYFVDWNDYRPQIERQISTLTGRSVKADGDIHMRFLPSPYLDLRDVRVLDSFPGAKKPFIQIDKFKLWLSAPSLLSGELVANKLELVNPVLNLVVDARGRGNWESFKKADATDQDLKIKSMSLQDVMIENGHIALHSLVEQGNEIFKTPAVSGIMSAHSLSGPYKFKGHLYKELGEDSVLNFSTGLSNDVDGMPINAFLKNLNTKATYQLSSRVKAIDGGKVSYKGKLSAKMPFETLLLKEKERLRIRSGDTKEPLEIKANLEGTATQAKLDNIHFALVRKNRPQALKGVVQLDWSHGDLQAVGQFNARSLNLDVLGSDVNQGFNVSTLISDLPKQIYSFGQAFHHADFSLKLDQIQVGGEVIRNLETNLFKDLKQLKISNMTARLPASSYLSLTGQIEKDERQDIIFNGPLVIQGRNAGRFKKWLMSSTEKSNLNKPFIFAAEVRAGKEELKFADIDGDLDGKTIHGDITRFSGKAQNLVVNLNLADLDAAALFGEDLSFADLVKSKRDQKDEGFDFSVLQGLSTDDLAQKKAKISIRVGQLALTDTVLTDFYLNFDFGNKQQGLKELSFISKDGLKIVLDGAIPSQKMTVGQKFNLRVETLEPEGVYQLVQMLDMDKSISKKDQRLALMHPVGLNIGLKRVGDDKGYQLLMNGQAGDSEVFAYGYMGGYDQSQDRQEGGDVSTSKTDEAYGFNNANLDLKVSINNPDGTSLLKQFVTDLAGENLAAIAKGEGNLNIQLVGQPKQGLLTEISGALPGLTLVGQGKIKIKDGQKDFAGSVNLEAANMSQGLALLGLGLETRPNAGGLSVKGNLVKKGDVYQLSNMTGKIGKSHIYGTVDLDRSAEKPVFNLDLTSQNARLVALLEPGIDWFKRQKNKTANTDTIWTDKPFDLALLNGFSGKLKLKSKVMEIEQGLVLQDAVLSAQYGDGELLIDELSGNAFGGQVQSAFRLHHGRAVSSVAGTIQVAGADLKTIFTENSDALATGKANLLLKYSGSGLSPKGILNLIKGEGQLDIIDTQLNNFSPLALQQIASETIETKESLAQFEKRFEGHLSAGQFNAGTQKFKIKIADGIASFNVKDLIDDGAKLNVKTYLSLVNLGLDSEWKLRGGKNDVTPQNMPAATVQFSGKIADLGEIKPTYKLQSVQRFLSVLKIEQDVDRLEELNSKLEQAAEAEKKARELQSSSPADEGSESSISGGVTVSPLQDLPEVNAASGAAQLFLP